MTIRPHGTVTFVFTDIESSTRLWDQNPEAMRAALATHDAILRSVLEAYAGYIFSTAGDAFGAAFPTARRAVDAAISVQRRLGVEPWPEPVVLRVRIGVHSGTADERDGNYFGSALNRAARVMAAGHGHQVLLSAATSELVRDTLAPDVSLIDLGIHALSGLARQEHLFQVCAPGLDQHFPPLRTLQSRPGNLPAQLTSIVGRAEQWQRVATILERSRIVTLTGPGGVGKTRFAVEVAEQIWDRFPDGAWLVDLAALRSEVAVLAAFATTLGVIQRPGSTLLESVRAHVSSRNLLVVLDNCEHVAAEGAALARDLCASGPGLAILATSRQPLHLPGETVVDVPPLADDEAARLFAARAAAARSGTALDSSEDAFVRDICRALDGLPLAIELAAARLHSLTVSDLAARLQHRLETLRQSDAGAGDRHSSLRSTIAWSHDLLEPAAQIAFRRLAPFAGSFDLSAAEAVIGFDPLGEDAVFELLDGLVERSLVVAELAGGGTRYRLLETLREFAAEQLSTVVEVDAARRRHGEYYACLTERAAAGLQTGMEVHWADRLATELNNLRAAARGAIAAGDPHLAFRLGGRINGLSGLERSTAREIDSWLEEAFVLPGAARSPLYVDAACRLMFQALLAGEMERSLQLSEETERVVQDLTRDQRAALLRARSSALLRLGRAAHADRCSAEVLALAPDDVDDYLRSTFLGAHAANHAFATGSLESCCEIIDESIAYARRTGSPLLLAHYLLVGGMLYAERELRTASDYFAEAAFHAEQTRNTWVADSLSGPMVAVAVRLGDRSVLKRLVTPLTTHAANLDRNGLTFTLLEAANALAALGEHRRAALLFGSIEGGVTGVRLPMAAVPAVQEVRSFLGEEVFGAVMAEAARLTYGDLVTTAVEIIEEAAVDRPR